MPAITANQILEHYGIDTKSFVIYNDPFDGYGPSPFPSETAALQFYYSQGFRIYTCIDASNGLGYYTDLYAACKASGILMTAPLYLWGYETQFEMNTDSYMTLPDPNEQEYYLAGMTAPGGSTGTTKPPLYPPYSLVPALAFKTYPGMTIDAPALLTAFKAFYAQLDSAIGLKNMIGISGALESDHPVNYNGAQGQMGGNNMNCYVRYVNSSTGLYQKDVNASGNHVTDGTACPLYALVGGTDDYTGSAIIPSVATAADVYAYHHYTSSPGGPVTNQSSSFGQYGAAANGLLEEGIFQYFQSINPYSFWRTAIPTGILNSYVPGWTNYVTYQGTSSPGAAIAFMNQYPGQIMLPFFNYDNCDDNSSNQISGTKDITCPCNSASQPSVGYGIATPATVLAFFNNWIPQLASYVPFMEADNEPCTMQYQSTATAWGTLGPQYALTPLNGELTPTVLTLKATVVS